MLDYYDRCYDHELQRSRADASVGSSAAAQAGLALVPRLDLAGLDDRQAAELLMAAT
jgi:hypothetical protein